MFKHIINFFVRLREKDETIKKRWFIGLTLFSSIFVLSLWSAYFTGNVQKISQQAKEKQSVSNAGLTATMINGVKVLTQETGNQISQMMEYFGSLAQQTNSITIEQSVPTEESIQPNFFAKYIEPVQVQKLP